MEYLDVLMVCSPDRFIPQLVIDHLLIQNIPLRFFISNCIGNGASHARNFVKKMWQPMPAKEKSKYVLTTDNDLLMPENSLKDMISFLDSNPDFAAISLQRNYLPQQLEEPKHINAGPVLYRSEIYSQITYHNDDGCECQGMTNDIRKIAIDPDQETFYRIGYLPNYQYEHIEHTRRHDYGQ